MARATSIIFLDETHPIDALELIAHEENWEFVRDEDNEIIVTIDGGWKICKKRHCEGVGCVTKPL